MILNKIILRNVGPYFGKHEINLKPDMDNDANRPIILFGGLNGSGKTSILKALLLCLYGKNYYENISKTQYQKNLRDFIHYSPQLLIQPTDSSIELNFDYSRFGELHSYSIKRSWEIKGKNIEESLYIRDDETILKNFGTEHWNEFIKEMIPPGLSKLFFFDGEKIQDIIDDSKEFEFKKSVKTLMGIELIDRLKSDLKIFKNRQIKNISSNNYKKTLEDIEFEHIFLKNEQIKIEEELDEINSRINDQNNIIKEYKKKINAQGGLFFEEKKKIENKIIQIEIELDAIKSKFIELADGLLPVLLANSISKNLKTNLESEIQLRKIKSNIQFLQENKEKILQSIMNFTEIRKGLNINDATISKIKDHTKVKFNRYIKKINNKNNTEEFFFLSEKNSHKLIGEIKYATKEIPKLINELSTKYEENHRALNNLHSKLQKAPEEELVVPLYEKLNELNKELGSLSKKKELKEESLTSKIIKVNEISKKVENLRETIIKASKKDIMIELSERVNSVLTKYDLKLASFKSKQLQSKFSEIFNKLHRKNDHIDRILIDPETLKLQLLNKKNIEISRNTLSSGELEIYAISMLWALAIVSGQNLPFIIDTPLGRLDSDHRENLVNIFFPNASQQIIIFSTDTEIDTAYYNDLKPYISKSYYIEFDDELKNSSIKEGYFWQ